MTINDIKTGLKRRIRKLLLSKEELNLISDYKQNSCFPPGHYYSPIVDVRNLKTKENVIWPSVPAIPQEVNLNTPRQIELLGQFRKFFSDFPYVKSQAGDLRYNPDNSYFNPFDALVLYSFIRHFCPKNVIEVGSGFSSSVMLDTNEKFAGLSIRMTFIEPYPERLKTLLRSDDKKTSEIIEQELQEIPIDTFRRLQENDILFIDSTHVCKTGSDLNYLFFHILPILNKGVIVHFHDVFDGFEYPRKWVLEGRNWNEIYMLESFLMYNSSFSILFFNDYLFNNHLNDVNEAFPFPGLTSGGSIYIKKNN
jgi:predicted O-methyltransferase YrrM